MSLRVSYFALLALALVIAAQASGGLALITGRSATASVPHVAFSATQVAQAKK